MYSSFSLRLSCVVAFASILCCSGSAEFSEFSEFSSSNDPSERCPITLVKVASTSSDGTEGLVLDPEGLAYISRLRSPLYVISALGVYRGGKSLLLNRLSGRTAPYKNGFGIGHGQETFTRGIQMCAEEVPEFGTIAWLDTEGLFSSEEAQSAYGPKLFSLALLFSSTIFLNSVQVLNDQFFGYFAEQQQLARVLKLGLEEQGLPEDALLPNDMKVFWILQKPVKYDPSGETSLQQLESFLSLPDDKSRSRVKRDFEHRVHEVPIATHDSRLWERLDTLPDEELATEYINSTRTLRSRLLDELRTTRPASAASLTAQLKMYVQLVQTETFSKSMVMEAFEEAESGRLCEEYAASISGRIGGAFPAEIETGMFEEARQELQEQRKLVAEKFHLGTEWQDRLDACMARRDKELKDKNSEAIENAWRDEVTRLAQEGECFFLGDLVQLRNSYAKQFREAWDIQLQRKAVSFATSLQRTRLVECVRLRDFLWPLLPWLLWPARCLYLRSGLISGLITMCIHIVGLAGIYMVLQVFHQLPAYLDVDYRILRAHPTLLNIVMRAPPLMPWAFFGQIFGLFGLVGSLWYPVKCLLSLGRQPGSQQTVPQLLNLELKMNLVLKRSEAAYRQRLVAAALDVSEDLAKSESSRAGRALLRGLVSACDLSSEDYVLSSLLDDRQRRKAKQAAQILARKLASNSFERCGGGGNIEHRLELLAVAGDIEELLGEMVRLSQVLANGVKSKQTSPIKPLKLLAGSSASERVDSSFGEIDGDGDCPSPIVGEEFDPEQEHEHDEDDLDLEDDEEAELVEGNSTFDHDIDEVDDADGEGASTAELDRSMATQVSDQDRTRETVHEDDDYEEVDPTPPILRGCCLLVVVLLGLALAVVVIQAGQASGLLPRPDPVATPEL
mmetsp:Transcript_17137/g.36775  ORF Transcript_17137/g.36775 Transcript_17137/m.36775 type:complete len:902 (+) Transcript_17137:99-2804(+)